MATDRIDDVLSILDKEFGKGSVVRLGGQVLADIPVVSTGALTLDIALGVGGFPRGRIIEIYGPESSGKCLTADTYVSGPMGLLTIAEIFEQQGNPATCTSRTTECSVPLQNRHGKVEETTHFTHNNRRPTWTVKTRSGAQVRCTANHPHLEMNKRGNLVWTETKNLQPGAFLAAARHTIPGPADRNPTEMYLLGLLIADGNIYDNKIMVTNDDPDVKTFLENDAPEMIGVGPRIYANNEKESLQYHFNSKASIAEFCRRTTSPIGQTAGTKTIPAYVRTSSLPGLRAFIQGYMDSESSIDNKGIEVTSKSHHVLATLKLLLTQFGIISRLSVKSVSAYPDEQYWRLTITGAAARLYADRIGSRSQKVRSNFRKFASDGGSTNIDSVPHQEWILRDLYDASETNRESNDLICDYMAPAPRASLTYDRLKRIVDSGHFAEGPLLNHLRMLLETDYFYDEIVSITENQPEPTFDFAMSKTASFIANGIVTHNTTLSLHAIAEAQKAGGIAAFVDVEHALDPQYAKTLGIDLDNLLLTQPDSGEDALNITETLVRTNKVDIVVIDSVAALVPKAEIEGDMGDTHVGLQARLMSQAMRKLTSAIAKSKTIVIFINQIRNKVGVIYGSPEVTSGGNALKFYASVRLDVRKAEQIKVGTDVVGIKTKVKVVKNKVAPPFKVAEYDVLFGKGISRHGMILDLAVEYGFANKSGAWYTRADERLGHGRDATIRMMAENEELTAELESAVRARAFAQPPKLKDVSAVA